jgi:hypothetical protein
MPKSIYFTDDRYEQIVEAARKSGFRVSRGRGSQLAQFVVWASNTACSGRLPGHAETCNCDDCYNGVLAQKRLAAAAKA